MMTYYVRAFCVHGEIPTIGSVLAWAAEQDLDLTPPPEPPPFVTSVGEQPTDWRSWTPEELAGRDWHVVNLWWHKDWTPLEVDIDDGDDGWGDVVAEPAPSRRRDEVLAHLARTRFVVRMRLPISALDDDALWEAVSVVLDYFVKHHGALVQIEREGFYRGDQLILETTW